MTIFPTNFHEYYDVVQGVALLGGLLLFLYDKLKLSVSNATEIKELNTSIEALTDTVNMLANSVNNLQGQLEIIKQVTIR